MFKKETVFILGAGASCPYGYPSGTDLIKRIINNITDDHIYIPRLDNINDNYYWNDNNGKLVNNKLQSPYLLDDFIKYFEETQPNLFNTSSHKNYNENGLSINSLAYIKINIYQIKEFFDLKQALLDFDPISIDTFLRDNRKYSIAGKIMINYTLLRSENISNPDNDKWYSYLLNDILSGCNKPEDVLDNKLNILTFNYDVSLDYYLYDKLIIPMITFASPGYVAGAPLSGLQFCKS